MTARRILFGLILLAGGGRLLESETVMGPTLPGAVEAYGEAGPLRVAGSYVRRYWHIPLYRVTLETPDPQEIACRYRQSRFAGPGIVASGAAPRAGQPDWRDLADFLLDPQNRIPVRLSMQMLIGLKGYADESRAVRAALGRMGLSLDEGWRLQAGRELQGEVNRLAEAVLGLSADRPGPYYRCRRKGDVYVFSLDGNGRATLAYRPAAGNKAALAGRTDFQDHRVLAALVGAFLLPASGEEGASSAALLRAIQEACASGGRSAAEALPRPKAGGNRRTAGDTSRNWHDERFNDSLKGMTATRSLRALLLPLLAALALLPGAASAAPQRIVLAGRAVALVADAVYAFPEARDRVAASAPTDQGLGNFHELVDPFLPSRPALDRQAGPERIAALKPDLVLFKSSQAAVLQAPLEALGIAARGLSLETPEDWTEEILRLGEWLGEEDRGREVASYFRSTYEAVRAKAGAAAARPTVLVLYVSAASGDAFNVPPAAWMQTRTAGVAGGTPVWAGANPGSGWARVSFEQIAAWNPDFIAVASYAADSSAAAAGLRADPRFRALAAGKSGRILAFPQDFYSWDQSGARWILGLVWLARQLHPDRFPPGAVLEEARRFYRVLYGFSGERFDAIIRPRLKGDYAR